MQYRAFCIIIITFIIIFIIVVTVTMSFPMAAYKCGDGIKIMHYAIIIIIIDI